MHRHNACVWGTDDSSTGKRKNLPAPCIAMAVVARTHRLTDREASSPPMTVELMRRGISIEAFVTR
jgi:hypothetical protein